MEFYKVQSFDEITDSLIIALIERYKLKEVPRLKKLNDYYLGKTEIQNRTMSDSAKPNNKVEAPFASLIVNTVQGYFLGNPIGYSSNQEDHMLKLQDIFDKNHEQAHNSKLGKQLSISGIAMELLYINKENEVRFATLPPEETFMIYDNSVERKKLACIRFYEIADYVAESSVTHVEVYTDNTIQSFKIDGEELVLIDEQPHYFQEIPVNVYFNTDEATGDFEKVMSLIDGYCLSQSDTANSIEYFADAYLILSNIDMSEEDLQTMKEKRVVLLGENGTAEFLTKSAQNMEIESYKERLKEDIHSLSCIPSLSDEKFNNVSGESLKYKLFGLETITSLKERLFEKSLEHRIKLITNILNIKSSGQYVHTDIVMHFQRNLPTNYAQIVDMIAKLQGVISNKTLIGLLDFVDDVESEIQLLEDQNQDTIYTSFELNGAIDESANVTSITSGENVVS